MSAGCDDEQLFPCKRTVFDEGMRLHGPAVEGDVDFAFDQTSVIFFRISVKQQHLHIGMQLFEGRKNGGECVGAAHIGEEYVDLTGIAFADVGHFRLQILLQQKDFGGLFYVAFSCVGQHKPMAGLLKKL